jgi:hypothetical protein
MISTASNRVMSSCAAGMEHSPGACTCMCACTCPVAACMTCRSAGSTRRKHTMHSSPLPTKHIENGIPQARPTRLHNPSTSSAKPRVHAQCTGSAAAKIATRAMLHGACIHKCHNRSALRRGTGGCVRDPRCLRMATSIQAWQWCKRCPRPGAPSLRPHSAL